MNRIVIGSTCFALCATLAHAGIDEGVNRIRERGCEGVPALKAPLHRSGGLDDVAREWSKGGRLQEAIARTDYRIVSSESMHIESAADERAALNLLEARYCRTILNPLFTEIGAHERDRHIWVVVAAPLRMPTADEASKVSARVLELVNVARDGRRKCGRHAFASAAALKLSPLLTRAALVHAKDMSANGFLGHRGSDKSRPADRVSWVGYRWQLVAENVAAGPAADPQAVVRGWLESPGHCANIMNPRYREMGVAYYTDPERKGDVYWVQVFAEPGH